MLTLEKQKNDFFFLTSKMSSFSKNDGLAIMDKETRKRYVRSENMGESLLFTVLKVKLGGVSTASHLLSVVDLREWAVAGQREILLSSL